jgi:DNA polymerase V
VNKDTPTLLLSMVQAGFPSPGDDLESSPINTNELLVKNPAATFFMRVGGKSMQDSGIYEGDIIVIDKSLEPKNKDIVVAVVNGSFTLKFLKLQKGKTPALIPANKDFKSINFGEEDEMSVWGVVTSVIRKYR